MTTTPPTPHLQRRLKLHHLILYGIVIIQPTAPMGIYGVVSNAARGHVVTAILISMAAMLLTAMSYGIMARIYPSAGSAYTYVGKGIHPLAGYLTGWSMLMDYVLNPIICVIWCAAAAQNILPQVPYAAWAVSFTFLFTALNLRGVQTSGRINAILATIMSLVVAIFLAFAIRYIALIARPLGAQWLTPFYDPTTFSPSRIIHGTSIAVLTYVGFDGISTMSEEVENPQRNILLATVLTCLAIGILSALEVYAAQLIQPYHIPFTSTQVDTAYVQTAQRIGGPALFQLLNAILLIANLGSGLTAQFGAARLLYGMGKGNALPKRFFSQISPGTGVPRNNVLLLGAITLTGTFLLTYEKGAELLNFGAFIAFMGVDAAAFRYLCFQSENKRPLAGAAALLGLIICAIIWFHLSPAAKFLGFLWMAAGLLLYLLRKSRSTVEA